MCQLLIILFEARVLPRELGLGSGCPTLGCERVQMCEGVHAYTDTTVGGRLGRQTES